MKFNLIPEINRALIGFEQAFSQVHQTYPPYNIIKTEKGYVVEMAVSGFDKTELTVTQKDQTLEISGTKVKTGGEYLVQTLALRNFNKSFQVGSGLEVVSVTQVNGILTIELAHKKTAAETITFEIA